MVCGRGDRLSVHHVVPARLGGGDSMDNLVTVCVLHHRQADAPLQRGRQGERFEDDPERGIFWVRRANRAESRNDGRGPGSTGAPKNSGSGTDSGDAWASVRECHPTRPGRLLPTR